MSNDPYAIPGVCPRCGCSSSDFIFDTWIEDASGGFTAAWDCPSCWETINEDDIVSKDEWCRERAEDERLHYEEEE